MYTCQWHTRTRPHAHRIKPKSQPGSDEYTHTPTHTEIHTHERKHLLRVNRRNDDETRMRWCVRVLTAVHLCCEATSYICNVICKWPFVDVIGHRCAYTHTYTLARTDRQYKRDRFGSIMLVGEWIWHEGGGKKFTYRKCRGWMLAWTANVVI